MLTKDLNNDLYIFHFAHLSVFHGPCCIILPLLGPKRTGVFHKTLAHINSVARISSANIMGFSSGDFILEEGSTLGTNQHRAESST